MNFGDIPTNTTIGSSQSIRLNASGSAFEAYTPSAGSGVDDGDYGDIVVSGGGGQWDISNDIVTYAKMQNVSASGYVLGRRTGGAGDVEEVSTTQVLDFLGAASSGSILYKGSSSWSILGPGTNGQVLTASGNAVPYWKTPAAGGEAFPVGSVFLSVVSTNPATLLGYGTWSQISQGKMLTGFSSGDANFGTVEATGGAKTHTLAITNLPSHSHTVTDPGHTHLIEGFPTATGGLTGFTRDTSMSGTPANTNQQSATGFTNITLANTGSGTAVDHLNPYFVIWIWKRTA